MIILERSASIVFFLHSPSSLKNLFSMAEKKIILDNTLVTWQDGKLDEKKFSATGLFHFISVGVWAALRFLVSIKNLTQSKKLPWDKFAKKIICGYYLMNWTGDSEMKKKKQNILLDTIYIYIYIFFYKKKKKKILCVFKKNDL